MKTSVVNFWNRSNVITQDKEAQLKYSYDQHVTQLMNMQTSRKILVDNSAPYVMKKRNVSLSKPVKERQFAIEQENGALIHKMLEVKKKGGEYSKDHLIKAVQTHSAPKSLFLPLKIATEKKVYEENKVMDKDFEKSIKYKDNITKRSRRIYNCFLMEGSFMSGAATTSALNSHSTSRLSKGRYSSMDEIGKKKRELQGFQDEQQHFLELPAKKKGKKKQSTKSKQNSMVAEQTGEEDDQVQTETKKQYEQQKNSGQEEQQAQGIDNNNNGGDNTVDVDKKGNEEGQTKQGQEAIVEQDKTANAN